MTFRESLGSALRNAVGTQPDERNKKEEKP